MPSLEIFKPVADTISSEGKVVTINAAKLYAIAAAYSPKLHEAPLVIGHPTHDAPAYGWVKSLRFDGQALYADTSQCAELVDLVQKGHYRKVSASFYEPGANGNPTPDNFYLRHLGFLGAMPPGVKGLRAVSFSDVGKGVVTFAEVNLRGLPALSNRDVADLAIAYQDQCKSEGRWVSTAHAVRAVTGQ